MAREDAGCPLKYTLGLVGGKWKLSIICMLSKASPMRYSLIRRKLGGVTNTMLAQSLKELETAGLISRKQYNEVPPRVEYRITQEGESLVPILDDLASWGLTHMEKGVAHCGGCTEC